MYWESDSVGRCLAVLMLEYLLSAIHYTCTLYNIIDSLRIFGENVCFTILIHFLHWVSAVGICIALGS